MHFFFAKISHEIGGNRQWAIFRSFAQWHGRYSSPDHMALA